jgi:hypothetical protein
MNTLKLAAALAFGLAIAVTLLNELGPQPAALSRAISAAARHLIKGPVHKAEVSIAFDKAGRPLAHVLRRSSGSMRSDALAVSSAMELASLRQPADLAGRTLSFTASFGDEIQLD